MVEVDEQSTATRSFSSDNANELATVNDEC